MKRVIVLMPTYNGEKYIVEQLDSIINQKGDFTLDVLIRDDGSKDNTVNILKQYIEVHENIRLIEGTNIGSNQSFFELIKIAGDYDYYCLSDQDDVWLPKKIETAIEWLEKENSNIPLLYGCSSTLVDVNLNEVGRLNSVHKISFYNAMIQNICPGHNAVFNKKTRELLMIEFDVSKIMVHDYWIYLVVSAFGKVMFNPISFTLYRQHGNNQIGYRKGKIAWVTERISRVKKGIAKQMTVQDSEFLKTFKNDLKEPYRLELEGFINSQKNIFSRTLYLIRAKVFRQSIDQTVMFYLLYFIGGYKIGSK